MQALTQVHEAATGERLIARIHFGDGVPQNGHGVGERGGHWAPKIRAAFHVREGEDLRIDP